MDNNNKAAERQLNVILFGESAVGKTTLIMRYPPAQRLM